MKDNELTLRACILGAVIAVIFTAANIYLGLRVGITIASSIPAAVISMGILRAFNTGTIRENNIVQTVASSGGTLSSIIFVLPGLIMIGWWQGFPFWTTFLICALGGILGVLFSIPLRRALVVNSPLPFPEGVAAAEVLKVGAHGDEASGNAIERERGIWIVAFGALVAAVNLAISFTGFAATEMQKFFRFAGGATGFNFGWSLALVGAGHLVGLGVGIAQLLGLIIAWGFAVPMLSQHLPGAAADVAENVWVNQVRFIGAGAIGVAAIWSLIKLVKPVYDGMLVTARANAAARAGGGAKPATDDRDISMNWIIGLSLASLAGIAALLFAFIGDGPLASISVPLVIFGVVFVVIIGAFIATVAGYMAGLIGSSNSPVSGIGILATVAAAGALALFALPVLGQGGAAPLVAFALFAVSIVFSVATISNDNLQDLKTGYLVGATPWRQQVALIIGVLAGALVTGPVLDLLNHSNGFPGDPHPVAIAGAQALAAPQATLISTLAKGILNAELNWTMIGIGVAIGVALIVLDEVLGLLKRIRLPPLAVGIGIYLPMTATTPVIVGAVLGWLYNRAMVKRENGEMLKRFGVLLASGLIVGESLLGVLNAGAVVAANNPAPFAFAPAGFGPASEWVGLVLFVAFTAYSYWWVSRQAKAKS